MNLLLPLEGASILYASINRPLGNWDFFKKKKEHFIDNKLQITNKNKDQ